MVLVASHLQVRNSHFVFTFSPLYFHRTARDVPVLMLRSIGSSQQRYGMDFEFSRCDRCDPIPSFRFRNHVLPMSNSRSKRGKPTAVHNPEGGEDLDRFRIACKTASKPNIHSVVVYSLRYDGTPGFSLNSQRQFGKTEPNDEQTASLFQGSQRTSWQP
jgi:hypothetical protein